MRPNYYLKTCKIVHPEKTHMCVRFYKVDDKFFRSEYVLTLEEAREVANGAFAFKFESEDACMKDFMGSVEEHGYSLEKEWTEDIAKIIEGSNR